MKFDKLMIRYMCCEHNSHDQDFEFLMKLYEQGVYKNLILYALNGLSSRTNLIQITGKSLGRIYFRCVYSDGILLCLRHAIKLKEIIAAYFAMSITNELIAWNNERKKLYGAQKVTIYVDKRTFLAVKKTTQQTNFEMIELKPNHLRELNQDFDYPYYRPIMY